MCEPLVISTLAKTGIQRCTLIAYTMKCMIGNIGWWEKQEIKAKFLGGESKKGGVTQRTKEM
jgi:hypothetical protein